MMVTVQMTETYLEYLLTENVIDKDQILTVEAIERDLEQSENTDSNSTTDSILTQCDSFYQWLIKPDAPQAQPQANGATPQASPQPSQPVQDQMNFEQPPQWVDQA